MENDFLERAITHAQTMYKGCIYNMSMEDISEIITYYHDKNEGFESDDYRWIKDIPQGRKELLNEVENYIFIAIHCVDFREKRQQLEIFGLFNVQSRIQQEVNNGCFLYLQRTTSRDSFREYFMCVQKYYDELRLILKSESLSPQRIEPTQNTKPIEMKQQPPTMEAVEETPKVIVELTKLQWNASKSALYHLFARLSELNTVKGKTPLNYTPKQLAAFLSESFTNLPEKKTIEREIQKYRANGGSAEKDPPKDTIDLEGIDFDS